MMLCALDNNSRFSADLIRIPSCAPFPVPTIIAVGVANPKAHGHEMTKTAMAHVKAKWNVCCPSVIHKIKVTNEITMTIGTKIPLIRSASLAIGALEELASSTSSIICDKVAS